jgi:hypothetical protein
LEWGGREGHKGEGAVEGAGLAVVANRDYVDLYHSFNQCQRPSL